METEEPCDVKGADLELAALFNSLPAKLKPGRITKAAIFYFSIDDENWTIAVGPDHCSVEQGRPAQEADCSLKASKPLVLAILRREYTPTMMDFLSGKIKSDNPLLLAVLRDVFGD